MSYSLKNKHLRNNGKEKFKSRKWFPCGPMRSMLAFLIWVGSVQRRGIKSPRRPPRARRSHGSSERASSFPCYFQWALKTFLPYPLPTGSQTLPSWPGHSALKWGSRAYKETRTQGLNHGGPCLRQGPPSSDSFPLYQLVTETHHGLSSVWLLRLRHSHSFTQGILLRKRKSRTGQCSPELRPLWVMQLSWGALGAPKLSVKALRTPDSCSGTGSPRSLSGPQSSHL